MNFSSLTTQMQEKRHCGITDVLVFERTEGIAWEEQLIDRSVSEKIFSWHTIIFYRKNKKSIAEQPIAVANVQEVLEEITDRQHAMEILSQLLYKDMAYNVKMMLREDASQLASIFFSFFHPDARFYSNSSWPLNEKTGEREVSGWNSLTEATFDSGIIIVDSDRIGIAWFSDED